MKAVSWFIIIFLYLDGRAPGNNFSSPFEQSFFQPPAFTFSRRVTRLCRKRQIMSFWRLKSRQILRNVGSRFYVVFALFWSFLSRFWMSTNSPCVWHKIQQNTAKKPQKFCRLRRQFIGHIVLILRLGYEKKGSLILRLL